MHVRSETIPERHLAPPEAPVRFLRIVGADLDCKACDIAWELGLVAGCAIGDWFCTSDCRIEGRHVERTTRICLHPVSIDVVS